MHLHIIGICGTFMGGIAALARASGHRVTGSDRNVYPPMSTQLAELGIDVIEGYSADQLSLDPDVFVIGNVMSRGNELIEALLDSGCRYESGPEWLARHSAGLSPHPRRGWRWRHRPGRGWCPAMAARRPGGHQRQPRLRQVSLLPCRSG